MKTVCKLDMCTGCTACKLSCGKDAIRIEKTIEAYNAVINEEKCVGCGLCHKICPQENKAELTEPVLWKQGWTKNEKIRSNSASGGYASAIMKAFVESGGIVSSCKFDSGEFKFSCVDSVEKLVNFAGSKYIKSDPGDVFIEIRQYLKRGRKVLFLGLPCQAAGLKRFIPQRYQSELYIVDLVCHGTPSIIILEQYLKEHGIDLKKIKDIRFRKKSSFKIVQDYKPIAVEGMEDRYIISFLRCLNYTPNCYSCSYAGKERCSDLTLGDSWGTTLSKEEQSKGVSLALCQNEKGKELLEMSDLEVLDVDVERAIANNKQLRYSAQNTKRSTFFKYLNNGMKYDRAMFMTYPITFIKQDIKSMYLKMKKIFGGGYFQDNRNRVHYPDKEILKTTVPLVSKASRNDQTMVFIPEVVAC